MGYRDFDKDVDRLYRTAGQRFVPPERDEFSLPKPLVVAMALVILGLLAAVIVIFT